MEQVPVSELDVQLDFVVAASTTYKVVKML